MSAPPSTAREQPDARTLTKFRTQKPLLANERKQRTALAAALDVLHSLTTSDEWQHKTVATAAGALRSDKPLVASTTSSAIDTALETFFDDVLAPVIQQRESALVNVMHECFETELAAKQQLVATQREHVDTLLQQHESHERAAALWQSKLDRRVAETNELRKDYYKQLLQLRELVYKQKHSDPKTTLKLLDDALATVSMPKDKAVAFRASVAGAASANQSFTDTASTKPSGSAKSVGSASRSNAKWEERAREATTACQQLQAQVLQLQQQIDVLQTRELDDGWFVGAHSGLVERQRVFDAVYRGKCSWDDVGAAITEVLNNDLIWDAVETSARQHKDRASRGLEAVLVQLDTLDNDSDLVERLTQQQAARRDVSATDDAGSITRRLYGHRRSSCDTMRLVQCRVCHGAGFMDANSDGDDSSDTTTSGADSYLRKTLAQVLELRAALEAAGARSLQLEHELQATAAESMVVKQQLELLESVRRHGVDRAIQADLDDEEVVDLDAIMRMSASTLDLSGAGIGLGSGFDVKRFTSNRSAQYEHLIVELKTSLDEKDSAIRELRAAHTSVQERLRSAQLAAQTALDAHVQEVTTLQTSLTLALTQQNTGIEAQQAAVTRELQKLESRRRSTALSLKSIASDADDDDGDDSSSDNDDDAMDDLVALSDPELEAMDEVKRSEVVARRYSQAIVRVQREYESQRSLLQQSEDAIGLADETRKRTNSIAFGSSNTIVSLASHPRELFKALSTSQTELLSLRRVSQRASTLQTDRLLTLTTHLGHLSEELCMVRKRTRAEIEFWQLECAKTQNERKAVAADLERTQLQLQTAKGVGDDSSGTCSLCVKHQTRLLAISSALLLKDTQNSLADDHYQQQHAAAGRIGSVDNGKEVSAGATLSTGATNQLTQQERESVSAMVLEIETLLATMSTAKQANAQQLLAFALFGDDHVDVRVATETSVRRRSTQVELARVSPPVSPRTFGQQNSSDAARRRLGSIHNDATSPCEPNARKNSNSINGLVDSATAASPSQRIDGSSDNQPTSTTHGDVMSRSDATSLFDSLRVSDGGNGDSFAMSHRTKKIVRKILSDDEVLRRRYVQVSRSRAGSLTDPERLLAIGDDVQQLQSNCCTDADASAVTTSDVDTVSRPLNCLSFIDANGLEVFYEDIEVEIDDDEDEDAMAFGSGNQYDDEEDVALSGRTSAARGGVQDSQQALNGAAAACHKSMPAVRIPSPTTRNIALLDDASDIASDPEVIAQLRSLVKQHAAVKECLALTNWRILIDHMRALRDQNRLDWMTLETKRVGYAGSNSRLAGARVDRRHAAVRNTMQKLVERRESCLDAAIRARDDMRRDARRVQAHLIHSVSTILTNLSRLHNKSRVASSDSEHARVVFDPERASPRRYVAHTNRLLYPAAQVDLSRLPSTQQIATPHFPLPSVSRSPAQTPRLAQPPSPVRGRPYSAAAAAADAGSSSERIGLFEPAHSVFEDDNRFPQRTVRFVADGCEYSLAHSLSSIAHASRSLGTSPTKDPSKSPTLRAESRSASPCKRETEQPQGYPTQQNAVKSPGATSSEQQPSVPTRQLPVRPQSSPAGLAPRFASPRTRELASARVANQVEALLED